MIRQSPRVFVSNAMPARHLRDLRPWWTIEQWDGAGAVPRGELLERASECVGLLCTLNERIDAEFLDSAPDLRVVSNMAVGVDNIDLVECTRRGILVTNTPGVLTDATADLAIALMLAAARRLPEAAMAVRSGEWTDWSPTWLTGLELAGATLGIIGRGAIGQATERRAQAFGMEVIHNSSSGGVPLDELLGRSDVVSIHCPLTRTTERLIDADALARMKRDAILVNTARGAIVDQEALVDALTTRRIGAAALDVTVPEPLPTDHPLLLLDNCIVVPHIGSATTRTRGRMADLAATAIVDVIEGRSPAHTVNATRNTA